MKKQQIAQLEAQLEHLIEGTFANIFSRRLNSHDIALQIARAMEDHVATDPKDPKHKTAPNDYFIYLHPDTQRKLLSKVPDLSVTLGEQITELAQQLGYIIVGDPIVNLLANPRMKSHEVQVVASHRISAHNSTKAMQRVTLPDPHTSPTGAQLLFDSGAIIPLTQTIINIGRNAKNEIVLDDEMVSRHHVQIRLRAGAYILFDTQSRSGTYVNDVRIREHTLRSGDVILLGKTRLLYTEDDFNDATDHNDIDQTDVFDPI